MLKKLKCDYRKTYVIGGDIGVQCFNPLRAPDGPSRIFNTLVCLDCTFSRKSLSKQKKWSSIKSFWYSLR